MKALAARVRTFLCVALLASTLSPAYGQVAKVLQESPLLISSSAIDEQNEIDKMWRSQQKINEKAGEKIAALEQCVATLQATIDDQKDKIASLTTRTTNLEKSNASSQTKTSLIENRPWWMPVSALLVVALLIIILIAIISTPRTSFEKNKEKVLHETFTGRPVLRETPTSPLAPVPPPPPQPEKTTPEKPEEEEPVPAIASAPMSAPIQKPFVVRDPNHLLESKIHKADLQGHPNKRQVLAYAEKKHLDHFIIMLRTDDSPDEKEVHSPCIVFITPDKDIQVFYQEEHFDRRNESGADRFHTTWEKRKGIVSKHIAEPSLNQSPARA